MKFQKLKKLLQLFTGLTLIVVGCVLLIGTPWLEKLIIRKSKILKPDGFIFRIWQKYPPLTHKFYLFDWKNPEDLYNPKIKPRFEEVGPFVFNYRTEKANITWNTNNNTITFRNLRYWHFDETQSVANLSRRIVTINALACVAAYRIRYWNSGIQKVADWALQTLSPKMYLEKSVGELLFDGYEDPLLGVANIVSLPQMFAFPGYDKIGWLRLRNGSQDIEEYVNAGTQGEDLGQINQWNFLSRLPFYSGECNTIKGSTGEFFSNSSQKQRIYFFWNDACRSFAFDFEKESFYRGVKTYTYSGKNVFDNGTIFEENKCYRIGDDVPTGTLNMSACRYGAPLFASLPHFYGADPYYLNSVEGLNPTKETHDTFAIIEPNTGVPIGGRARIQANMLLQPNKHLSMFKNVPKLYMPVLWLEQAGDLPSNYIMFLKVFLNLGIIMRLLAVLVACGGIFLIILGLKGQKKLKIYGNYRHVAKDKPVIHFVQTVPEKTDENSQFLKIATEKEQYCDES